MPQTPRPRRAPRRNQPCRAPLVRILPAESHHARILSEPVPARRPQKTKTNRAVAPPPSRFSVCARARRACRKSGSVSRRKKHPLLQARVLRPCPLRNMILPRALFLPQCVPAPAKCSGFRNVFRFPQSVLASAMCSGSRHTGNAAPVTADRFARFPLPRRRSTRSPRIRSLKPQCSTAAAPPLPCQKLFLKNRFPD